MRALKIFIGLFFLLIGSYLYLKFRSETLLMFKWAKNLDLEFILSSIRRSFESLNSDRMKYIIFLRHMVFG